ncbi:ferredoxin [Humibacter albus]|uniref:NADH-quinone oxidoreductase subunit B family protein n=1 Tax=Humibacter albus TaxID=427754 RepID=UPI0003B4B4BD|nr:ferredoxin [Humibacter albus]
MAWAPHGLANGTVTTKWPRRPDAYFDDFPASVEVVVPEDAAPAADAAVLAAANACPTRAIAVEAGEVSLDRGRCILCGRCTRLAPETFRFEPGSATASLGREGLIVGAHEENDEALQRLRADLKARVRHLGRSVHIRHVDAGSDGSDEWELQALSSPVYDIHRLGIFFTASPRHADILMVTGIGTDGMAGPLRRTLDGMPEPIVVMAVGTDAVSGGLVGGGYTDGIGIAPRLASGGRGVDVWVPGSPASPFSVLHGILLALGRVDESGLRTRRGGRA